MTLDEVTSQADHSQYKDKLVMTYAAQLLDMNEAMLSETEAPKREFSSTASSSHEMPQSSSQILTVPETTSHEMEDLDIPSNLEVLTVK